MIAPTRRPGSLSLGAGLAVLLGAGAGCGGDSGGSDPVDASPGDGDASGSDADVGEGLNGFLRDDGDRVLTNVQVAACQQTVCFFDRTDTTGRFQFEVEPTAEVALKTAPNLSVSPRLGATLCPVVVASAAPLHVGTLYVPHLPDGTPLGPAGNDPQTLAAGDGLELTLNRADLTPRVGDILVDVAARRIPAEQVCSRLEVPGEEIVAVYSLHPFGATSSSPIAVRASTTLPAGTDVNFWSISEIDGLLSDPAPGASDGSFVTTDGGAGITELSWLVISR